MSVEFTDGDQESWPFLMTLQEVARVLRLHQKSVRRLIDAGELAYVDAGAGGDRKRRLVPKSELLAFTSRRTRSEREEVPRASRPGRLKDPARSFLARFDKPRRNG